MQKSVEPENSSGRGGDEKRVNDGSENESPRPLARI